MIGRPDVCDCRCGSMKGIGLTMAQRTRTRLKLFRYGARLSNVSLREHPDYHHGYNSWHALISNGYARRYYQDQAAESPSLRALQPSIILKLAANDVSRLVQARIALLIIVPAVAGYLYITLSSGEFYISVTVGIVLLGIEQFMLWVLRDGRYEEFAADRLFFVIRELERNSQFWSDTKFRWSHAADLEMAARALERIPFSLRRVAPGVRKEVVTTSRAKAQAMRDLEIRAIKPGTFTYSDMTNRLTEDMRTILEGRWYELPEATYEPQVSRWLLALRFCGAFILIGGAITLIGFASKLGSAASVLATILIAVAIYFLNMAGIPIGVVERYERIGSGMTPNK
jgi:hypothetical protein